MRERRVPAPGPIAGGQLGGGQDVIARIVDDDQFRQNFADRYRPPRPAMSMQTRWVHRRPCSISGLTCMGQSSFLQFCPRAEHALRYFDNQRRLHLVLHRRRGSEADRLKICGGE